MRSVTPFTDAAVQYLALESQGSVRYGLQAAIARCRILAKPCVHLRRQEQPTEWRDNLTRHSRGQNSLPLTPHPFVTLVFHFDVTLRAFCVTLPEYDACFFCVSTYYLVVPVLLNATKVLTAGKL